MATHTVQKEDTAMTKKTKADLVAELEALKAENAKLKENNAQQMAAQLEEGKFFIRHDPAVPIDSKGKNPIWGYANVPGIGMVRLAGWQRQHGYGGDCTPVQK